METTINGLPLHHDGNTYRVLGRIKTNNPKMTIRPFSEYLRQVGAPVLDLSKIDAYDRYQQNIPILDQTQNGSCVAHGHASAIMKQRELKGLTYVALSPDSLYAQIDGDRDGGSDPADAITALEQNGICLLSDVPDRFVYWSNISDAAKATAKRFRITSGGVYQCANFAEMVTADYLGGAITLTINVGNDFNNLDDDGVVPFAGGYANHCVSGGEALKFTSNGTPLYRFRNSWNTSWGVNGCAWMSAEHIDNQNGPEVYCIMWVLDDPEDPASKIPTTLVS